MKNIPFISPFSFSPLSSPSICLFLTFPPSSICLSLLIFSLQSSFNSLLFPSVLFQQSALPFSPLSTVSSSLQSSFNSLPFCHPFFPSIQPAPAHSSVLKPTVSPSISQSRHLSRSNIHHKASKANPDATNG